MSACSPCRMASIFVLLTQKPTAPGHGGCSQAECCAHRCISHLIRTAGRSSPSTTHIATTKRRSWQRLFARSLYSLGTPGQGARHPFAPFRHGLGERAANQLSPASDQIEKSGFR